MERSLIAAIIRNTPFFPSLAWPECWPVDHLRWRESFCWEVALCYDTWTVMECRCFFHTHWWIFGPCHTFTCFLLYINLFGAAFLPLWSYTGTFWLWIRLAERLLRCCPCLENVFYSFRTKASENPRITADHRLYIWGHPSNRKLGHVGFNHDGTEAGLLGCVHVLSHGQGSKLELQGLW